MTNFNEELREILSQMLVKDFKIDKKCLTNGYMGDLFVGDTILSITELVKKIVPSEEELQVFIASKMGDVLPENRKWMLNKLAEDIRTEILKRLEEK